MRSTVGNLWWGFFGALLYSAMALSQPLAEREGIADQNAERDYVPRYAGLAYGRLPAREEEASHPRRPWPVKVLSIGHTIASYQNYGSGDPYFHHGLDIRADAGSDVIASAGGKVVNIENYQPGQAAYWEIAILDDEGFVWQYHHIERRSIPASLFTAFKNGGRVEAGTKIGEIYYWPVVTFGERYHHTHLNILGAGDQYLDPFDFLVALPDRDGPKIRSVALVQDGAAVSGTTVSGSYTVAADIADPILNPKLVNPPHWVQVQIDGGKEEIVWRFDSIPGVADKTRYVHDFFVEGLACGDYQCRKPVIDLSFRPENSSEMRGGTHRAFPTGSGAHSVRIVAADYAGNLATKTYRWTVR